MVTPPFIDIEASGFGSASYPIEVGCVLADGASYCSLIRPEDDWRHWDAGAEAVHGISRDALARHGRTAPEVAAALNARLAGMTVITDAWYHDFNWVHRLFDAARMQPHFTLRDLRRLLDDDHAARWHATREAVEAELSLTRHRASHDARILQATYCRLLGSGIAGTDTATGAVVSAGT